MVLAGMELTFLLAPGVMLRFGPRMRNTSESTLVFLDC